MDPNPPSDIAGSSPPEILCESPFGNSVDDYDEWGDVTLVEGVKPLQRPPRFAVCFLCGYEQHDEADALASLIRGAGLDIAR